MNKEITLQVDHGTAKKGTVFVCGLHGVPDYYKDNPEMNTAEQWFWEKGSERHQNAFLHESWINPNV